MPVSISDATNIVSVEVFIQYDTDVLTVFSAPDSPTSTTGTMSAGWSVQTNTELAGNLETLKIAMATDDLTSTGAQTLINVHFSVNDPAPLARVPDFSDLTLTHVLLNDGIPPNVKINGQITVIGTDGTLDSSPEQFIPRDTLTLTVVDADAILPAARAKTTLALPSPTSTTATWSTPRSPKTRR